MRVDPDEAGVLRTPLLPSVLTAAPRHERPVAGDVLEFRRTRLAARPRGVR